VIYLGRIRLGKVIPVSKVLWKLKTNEVFEKRFSLPFCQKFEKLLNMWRKMVSGGLGTAVS